MMKHSPTVSQSYSDRYRNACAAISEILTCKDTISSANSFEYSNFDKWLGVSMSDELESDRNR